MGSNIIKKALPVALAIAGNAVGGPIGGSIGAAAGTKLSGGSWGQAIGAGAGNYIGGSLGATGEMGPGGTIGAKVASNFGTNAANFLPGVVASTNFGSAAGSALGQSIGSSLGAPKQQTGSGAPSFTAKQQKLTLPGSLAGAGMNTQQQLSNIATKGVYGGGTSVDEQKYFTSLLNNQLVDKKGKVSKDLNSINPIENSYLAQLGLSGYGKPKDLLSAISKKQYA